MIANRQTISIDELIPLVERYRGRKARLVGITAVENDESTDIMYHFDESLALSHVQLALPESRELPSITGLYPGAVVYENELIDQFGIRFPGLALDYGGRFLLDESVTTMPLCNPKTIPPKEES